MWLTRALSEGAVAVERPDLPPTMMNEVRADDATSKCRDYVSAIFAQVVVNGPTSRRQRRPAAWQLRSPQSFVTIVSATLWSMFY